MRWSLPSKQTLGVLVYTKRRIPARMHSSRRMRVPSRFVRKNSSREPQIPTLAAVWISASQPWTASRTWEVRARSQRTSSTP